MIGPFVLGQPIGHGGNGTVFRAHRKDSVEQVALKLIPLGKDPSRQESLRKRAANEAAALQKIRCVRIVRLHERGEHLIDGDPANDGYLYLALEFIPGVSLEERLRGADRPTADEALSVGLLVGEALTLAHHHELLHRDIKPANIMLRDNDLNDPVIVDFGSVRIANATAQTGTGHALATVGYMAPELAASGKSATQSSDLWSLARTVAVMLSDPVEITLDEAEQLPPDELTEHLVEKGYHEVGDVLARALQESPEDRQPDVETFLIELAAAAEEDGLRAGGRALRSGESLLEYLSRHGFDYADKRSSGGCLWVIASREAFSPHSVALVEASVHFQFSGQGGRASGYEPAWWTDSGA